MTIQEAIAYLKSIGFPVTGEGKQYYFTDADGVQFGPYDEAALIEEAKAQQWDDYLAEQYPWWNTEAWGPYPVDGEGNPLLPADAIEQMRAIESLGQGDVSQKFLDAIAAANEAALEAGQSGDRQAAQRASQRLADLKAQYAQWQQSIQPKAVAQNIPRPNDWDRVISEGGYDWAYDPATGDYTDLVGETPEKPRRSLDEVIEDYIIADDVDKAIGLYTTWKNMTRPTGLTPDQAASYIMGLPIAPDEMEEWIGALTDDWNAPRTPQERVAPPTRELFAPQQPLTAAERNAMPFRAPVPMGAGIPSGLAGQGASGLQFPSWMTEPGGMLSEEEIRAKIAEREARIAQKRALGMPIDDELAALAGLRAQLQSLYPQPVVPPEGPNGLTDEQKAALEQQEAMLEEQGGGQALTPEEVEARGGIFQGAGTAPTGTGTTPPIFDPVAAALSQTYPDMDSAYRVGVEMQSRTGKEYRVVEKDGGYGLIEAPAIFSPPGGGYGGPATGEGKVVGPPTGYGPTDQKERTETGWGTKPWPTPGFTPEGVPIPAFTPKGGSDVPFIPLSSELPEGGFLPPELLGDLEAQAAASGARVGRYGYSADQFANMPAPANETEARKKAMGQPYQTVHGYTFAPTRGYKTKQQEIEESNLADQQRRIFEPSSVTAGSPLDRKQLSALWQRGDQAPFERNIFGRPTPLSAQDALLQAKYRQWSQRRQKVFESQPVRRTVFK